MTEPTDIVPELLRGIRSDLRALTERVERNTARIDLLAAETTRGFTLVADELRALHERVDATNERLDETNGQLGRMVGHLHALHHVQADRFVQLEERMARVEEHVGLDRPAR